jgi:beta-galactosidase/beta-glucuronidase
MTQLGANCIRTYTVPPHWLLDLAHRYRLKVMVGIPWSQHITFLDSPDVIAEIRQTVANAVQACRDYPAVFAYLIGNEIPPDIVRWHGVEKVRTFLKELMTIVKAHHPDALVSYANYPSTDFTKSYQTPSSRL